MYSLQLTGLSTDFRVGGALPRVGGEIDYFLMELLIGII